MIVLHINTCSYGSTGTIAKNLCERIEIEGGEGYLCIPNGRHNRPRYRGKHIWIGGRLAEDIHLTMSRMTGLEGCFSIFATFFFLQKVRLINPDIIHLHNLHNSYINLPLLFKFIKKNNISVVWTLHDCWAVTGHCPHFLITQCSKWKTECSNCPVYKEYPQSYVDNSKFLHHMKKSLFLNLKDIVFVTPSVWLSSVLQESFLKNYPRKIINNGIDLEIFSPKNSRFREEYMISNEKNILLGVAFGWTYNKGIDVFFELANRLDPEKYVIVLVGTDDKIDAVMPKNIISIHRTLNQEELAKIYSAVDLFVNPSREENFPTVNIEALACGTPVIAFDSGGSNEVFDKFTGCSVQSNNIDAMEKEIIRICREKPFSPKDCRKRSLKFNKQDKYQEYIRLYEEMLNE